MTELPHLVYQDPNGARLVRPRVVHLVEAYDHIGGPPVLVRQMVFSPLSDKYDFYVISYAICGIHFPSLWRLLTILRQLRPDVVHVHGLKPDGFHAVVAARLAGVKGIVTVVHGSSGLSVSDYVTRAARARRWLVCNILEAATLRLSHVVYTVCDHMWRDAQVRRWSGGRLRCPIHNCVEIPNVQENKEEIRREFGFVPRDCLALFVGRICNNKGLLVLADAMEGVVASHPHANMKLVLVGDGVGPEYKEIRERFRRLEEGHTAVFLGARKDVFRLNHMADMFVLPSIFKENFSFALLEAAASAIPVIATSHGGNVELVISGKTGLMVPPGDCSALRDAILRLAGDAELRERLGEEGRKRVRAEFGLDRMLTSTDEVYREVLETRGRRRRSCDQRT